MVKKRIEVLSPAGTYESFLAAMKAGADAVYAGGDRFGARAFAGNFRAEELTQAIEYAHLFGRKFYLTLNTLVKESELSLIEDTLAPLCGAGLDAVIVQDIGVLEYVRENFPGLPIHCSTQMTLTGTDSAVFLEKLGASRIIPARELCIKEIRQIHEKCGLEIECFVHGSLCFSYSGQCLLSSLIGGRSGNRGRCAQPCRLPYDLLKEGRPCGLTENEKYLMSLRDLCALKLLPDLIEAGVCSFKIEGRMKKPEYAYEVTKLYRRYTDLYLEKGREGYHVVESDLKRLSDLYARGVTGTGYYEQHNGKSMLTLKSPGYLSDRKDSFSSAREELNQIELKLPAAGRIELAAGRPLELSLTCQGVTVKETGDIAEAALTRAVDGKDVEKQLKKTGKTPFILKDLTLLIEPGSFVSLKSLNELRRRGFLALRQKLLEEHARRTPPASWTKQAFLRAGSADTPDDCPSKEAGFPIPVRALVRSRDQLDAALQTDGIAGIYGECSLFLHGNDFSGELNRAAFLAHKAGKEFFAALPYIFRNETAERFKGMEEELISSQCDGFLVRSYEELYWLKGNGLLREERHKKRLITDFTLPVMNRFSHRFFLSQGAALDTASPELHSREYGELGLSESELLIYGHLPVMITAQCLLKTGFFRGRERAEQEKPGSSWLFLRDRKKNLFPVMNECDFCYNVIYNCRPLSLHSERDRIRELAPAGARLQFTVEDGEETRRIAGYYAALFGKRSVPACGTTSPEGADSATACPVSEYTKGHFRRGVE